MKAGRMLPTYPGYKVNNVLFRLRFTDEKDGSVSLRPVFFQYFLPKATRHKIHTIKYVLTGKYTY